MQLGEKQFVSIAVACVIGIGIGALAMTMFSGVEAPTSAYDEALAQQIQPATPQPPPVPELGTHAVEQIIGGDIVTIEGVGLVRLLGVDTYLGPDGNPMDPDVARITLQELTLGKKVTVVCDPTTADTEFKDASGAWLAYLMLEDGVLVNTELIARGSAVVDLARPYERKDELLLAERDAMWNMRGIWSKATAKVAPVPPSDLGGRPPSPPLRPMPPTIEPPKPGKNDVLVTKDGRFHKPSCRRGRGGVPMPIDDARSKHYLADPECFVSPRVKV